MGELYLMSGSFHKGKQNSSVPIKHILQAYTLRKQFNLTSLIQVTFSTSLWKLVFAQFCKGNSMCWSQMGLMSFFS